MLQLENIIDLIDYSQEQMSVHIFYNGKNFEYFWVLRKKKRIYLWKTFFHICGKKEVDLLSGLFRRCFLRLLDRSGLKKISFNFKDLYDECTWELKKGPTSTSSR